MRISRFSLIELVVVISIILLITGLAVGGLGRRPTFASQEKVVRELEALFALVGRAAAVQGKSVEIQYFPEQRMFQMADSCSSENRGMLNNRQYLTETFRSLYLPPGVTVVFDGRETVREVISFQCFPDGTASGPPMSLIMDEERIFMKFSPLTGRLLVFRKEGHDF